MCHVDCFFVFIFFFKQKTAYEMRISDWSSDVCSSDLIDRFGDVGAKAEFLVLHVSEALLEQIRAHADPRTVAIEILERAVCHFEIGRASCRERVCQYV